jgi:ABC-type phosphate transport system substrate-binding protein
LSTCLAVVCTTVGALSLAVGGALPAHATTSMKSDYEPFGSATRGDVVGAGSDALTYVLDFGADGDVSGDSGYNDAGNVYKIINVDGAADSNGRYSMANGSALENWNPLDPTAVYRSGTYPTQRLNGSDSGIAALLSDTSASDPYIDFVPMSSAPTTIEAASADANGWQGLQDFVIGHDHLAEAADNITNAPAGLTATQLAEIYSCNDTTWASLGSTGPHANDKIIPFLPPYGSGSRDTFLGDIGLPEDELGLCVVSAEDSDPTAITSLTGTTSPYYGTTCAPACSADAIEPMSGARLNLWSGLSGNTSYGANPGTGYFHDPTASYPGGAALTPGVHLLTGAPLGGGAAYDDDYPVNIVYRWTDQISSTPWQTGSTLNWADTLFCNLSGSTTTPFFQTPSGKTLIAEAGLDPSSQFCLGTPMT